MLSLSMLKTALAITMASPLLYCTIAGSPLSSYRPALFKNPSPPPPRLSAACASCGDRKGNHQFDRRDMLLGMGGLYGASNLVNSPAMADPIQAPDLNKCTTATDIFDSTVKYDYCCPPPGPNPAPNYVLPPVSKLRVRPALHLASNEYLSKFEAAIRAMKDLSVKDPKDPRGFDQQSHVHCAYCNGAYPQSEGSDKKLQIHFCWHFFPWHRWYVYFYERICAKLIGDPTFVLPFWNWDNPPGMVMPDIFTRENSPLYNPKRDLSHYPPAVVDLQYAGNPNPNPPDQIIKNNLTEMYNEMVQNGNTLDLFYGGKYVVGSSENLNSAGKVEAGSHTAMHRWVGQNTDRGYDMGNFATSGNDLLFFCTHVNIDRLWSVWRDKRDKEGKPKDFDTPDWKEAKFAFYDENAQLVTVKVGDALDNKKMGFTWQEVDNPWLTYKPKALVKQSKFASKTKAPKLKDAVFPAKLDKVLRVLVDRPKRLRSSKEKDEDREVLDLEVEVEGSKFVRFEVFVNDEDVSPEQLVGTAEYAGCYSQVPLTTTGRIKTKVRLDVTELLEELEIEDDDQILVSVVPKRGGEFISIGGIKVSYTG